MFYMFLADGFEETEALVTLDLLRRADISVKTVGIGRNEITGTHNICVKADLSEDKISISDCDGIILPGGMPGTENLYFSETVIKYVNFCYDNKKLISAICAAPIILGRLGYLKNKNAVCYPGFELQLSDATVLTEQSVADDNIITAKGAGCVFEFSYNLINYICDTSTADRIMKEIQHRAF